MFRYEKLAVMADSDLQPGLKLLKNSKILVNVDDVLQDILVVSYSYESKLFQGVLLDSTKRYGLHILDTLVKHLSL